MIQIRKSLFILLMLTITSCTSSITPTPELIPNSTATQPIIASTPVLYRGNAQRTGVYDFPAIRQQPDVKWQTKVGSTWLMPAMYSDGFLYAGSGDGTLYALNAETGEQVWSVGGFGQLEHTGVIAGDLIIAGGFNNFAKALDRKTGEEQWTYQTSRPIQGSPLVVNDRVYIATDQVVYALELDSGQLVWDASTGNGDAFMGAPAYEDGVIYATGGKLLLALDAETGKEIWRVEKPEIFLGLAVANDMVYVGNWDQYFYAFDRATGEEKWSFKAGSIFWSAPAVTENLVYAGNIDKMLYALDTKTGELKWSFQMAGDSPSEPVVSDGVVYVSDSSHETARGPRHLYALDAVSGKLLWTFETVSTFLPAPTLADKTIFVTSTGEILALEAP